MRRAKRKALLVLLEQYHYRVINSGRGFTRCRITEDVDSITWAMSELMLSHGRYDNATDS